jgi:predicted ATP-grasp superfamily ATP-dependent carboligase
MARNCRILLLDGETHHARNVAVCLSEGSNSRIYGFTSLKWTANNLSLKLCVLNRPSAVTDEAMVQLLREMVAAYKIDIVIACAVPGTTFLARNLEAIEGFVRCASVPSLENLRISDDKWITALQLDEAGVPNPKSVLIGPEAIKLGFPMLFKPRVGEGGRGILRIDNEEQFHAALAKLDGAQGQYIAQALIDGYDIDCSVLCRDGRVLASTEQHPIVRDRSGFSAATDIVVEPDADVLAVARDMLLKLKWNGIVHIDLRRAKNGEVFVIELNPRYWGTLLASLYAGVNFPQLALENAFGRQFAIPHYSRTACCSLASWIKGKTKIGVGPVLSLARLKARDPFPILWNRLSMMLPSSKFSGNNQSIPA